MDKLTSKQQLIINRMEPLVKAAPWVMRVTERKEFTGPVFEICERILTEASKSAADAQQMSLLPEAKRTKLKEWGRIYNGHMRVCLPAIRNIMIGMTDDQDHPLETNILLGDKISFRGNIPMGETAGGKLSLLFRLHPQVRSLERVELMAWRIERFTREETMYWLAKVSISSYGKRSVEWAKSGLRLMLAGQQHDLKEVNQLLEQLRK